MLEVIVGTFEFIGPWILVVVAVVALAFPGPVRARLKRAALSLGVVVCLLLAGSVLKIYLSAQVAAGKEADSRTGTDRETTVRSVGVQ